MIYSENPKIISKQEDKIILSFDGDQVILKKDSDICFLSDPYYGISDAMAEPRIFHMPFEYVYDSISGDHEDYYFEDDLQYICGVLVS